MGFPPMRARHFAVLSLTVASGCGDPAADAGGRAGDGASLSGHFDALGCD